MRGEGKARGRVGGGGGGEECFRAWNFFFRSYASLSFISRFTKSVIAFAQVLTNFFGQKIPTPSNKNKMVAP